MEEDEQKNFLDIACCFNGCKLKYVTQILHAHHDVCPKNGIRVLVDKSLVKIDDDKVTLHDLIQDMGKEIVRQESPEEPGKRSRMWFSKDIKHVLEENKVRMIDIDSWIVIFIFFQLFPFDYFMFSTSHSLLRI